MLLRSSLLLTFLGACGARATAPSAVAVATPAPVASPYDPKLASPAGFATCDVASVHDGALVAYAIAGDTLRETGRSKLFDASTTVESAEEGLGEGGFADRDHLFLAIGPRDVVEITAAGIAHVKIPPPSAFDRPKPSGDDMERGALGVIGTGLVISGGAAWWSQCPWGQGYDGFQCHAYVHARLWPTTTVEVDQPRLSPHEFPRPAAPAGFALKIADDDRSVTCRPPTGAAITLAADADDTEALDAASWISADPPLLLVTYGHAGLADVIPERWTLHAGCTEAPVVSGTTAEQGPGGLWLARVGEGDASHQYVYRGKTRLGEVPGRVLFRPAK